MRKFRAWVMFAVMGLFVFFVAGCGGGSLDPDTSSEDTDTDTDTDKPSAYTDTYNIIGTLQGRWILTEGSGEATSTVSGDEDILTLDMAANTQMNFADVNVSNDSGTALQYYSIRLQAFDDAGVYRGEFHLNSYRNDDDIQKFQQVKLAHYGENQWRAENADGDIMIMQFTSANSFNLSWSGFKYLNSGNQRTKEYYCSLSCSFIKQ